MDALRHELTTTDVVDTGVPSRSRPGSACLVGTDQLGEGGSLAQCAELTWQLRGTADARQVDGAQVALQHNLGLGGAALVTAYRRPVL